MKLAFEELTTYEKATLSDKEVSMYERLAAANAGAELPRANFVPFTDQKPQPDQTVYSVGDFMFSTRSAADQVAKLLADLAGFLRKSDYDWNIGYDFKKASPLEVIPGVEATRLFSEENYNNIATELKSYTLRKEAAEKDRKHHEKTLEAYETATEGVAQAVREAKSAVALWEYRQTQFDAYLELAEGDAAIAWNFFVKAGLSCPEFTPVGAPEGEGVPN